MTHEPTANGTAFDVLGLGCVAVDDLLYVQAFPVADAKCQVLTRQRECGGLTATALVAARRLGARCAYAGVLGDDELSQFVLQRFREESINTSHVLRRPGARPVASTIVVGRDRGTRNIFFDLTGAAGAADDQPSEAVLRSTRVLLLDHFGPKGMCRAARTARAAGIPVVADFERQDVESFAELLALPDHLVISDQFAYRLSGRQDPGLAAEELWHPARSVVVVTCGAQGCCYSTGPGRQGRQPAFAVKVADTTGCGDVFHGAYAAAVAWGWPLERRLRFASAAAALKASRPGGQQAVPNRGEVESFLRESAADW
jgi:ribokinase